MYFVDELDVGVVQAVLVEELVEIETLELDVEFLVLKRVVLVPQRRTPQRVAVYLRRILLLGLRLGFKIFSTRTTN